MNELYPWLTPLWAEWKSSLEHQRFANASMLIAQSGMGAEQLVDRLSRAVMCQHDHSEPCGFCHGCQLMQSQSHPDFHRVVPEKEGKAITVEQVRQCNRLAQESSQLGGYRLFVIEPAEAMNTSASNALLKTLEEPGENCLFLLVTHRQNHLLATITSRCQQWYLNTPSATDVAEWLSHHTQKAVPAFAAHIHANSPLDTLAFIEQGGESQYQQLESALLAFLVSQDDGVKLAKELAKASDESLPWLWTLLTDAQKVHFSVRDEAMTPGCQRLAETVSYPQLYQHTQSLTKLINQLSDHPGLNAELLIMSWLFSLKEELCS
ncbi:DNA polymerase III subunit delta' [Vibrio cholerae]